MIPGIDISHWQKEIDWREVRRSGVQFTFVKATEFPDRKTSLFRDDKFQVNVEGAEHNNILWGAYHFFRTHIDGVTQAQAFCETVGEFTSLPPVLDLEAAGIKGERLNHKVRQFLEEVERITNRVPIIYTSGGFWRSYLANERRSDTDWARKYPLWIAQYTNQWPTPLYPWAGWNFWQYSASGKLPGIKTNVDLNWFNGSHEDLENRYLHNREKSDPKHADVGKVQKQIQDQTPVEIEPFAYEFKDDYLDSFSDPIPKYNNSQQELIKRFFIPK